MPPYHMRRSTALLLTLGIVVFLAANSADFLFRQPYYEWWDLAANSLSVLRAKHFAQLYGPYSRFGFYHPSPAFFYVQALGEWLCYDLGHFVPSPLQGQLLINLCLMAGFYVTALGIFAHWLPTGRRWGFLCAALLLGVLQFSRMGNLPSTYDPLMGPSAFLSVWSGHSVVLPFLCLLTAGASVGAGRGRDLPWLVIAGGFLMEHVAESLFVASTAVVAYVGLVAGCGVRQRAETGGQGVNRWWVLAAWREHRRAHVAGALLLLLFALPMLIYLAWGRQSNFEEILRCLHDEVIDRKSLTRSFTYFLQYGAYAPYQTGADQFGHYDRSGFLAYVRGHALLYAGWLLVLALMLQAPFAFLWTMARRRHRAVPAFVVGTRRFLACAALLGTLSMGLSLYWGTRQAGPMYYFNSWFNFALYYFGALVAVAVLCTVRVVPPRVSDAEAAAGTASQPWSVPHLAGAGALILTAFLCADRLRIHADHPEVSLAMHRNVARAIADFDAVHPGVCKVLSVPDNYWTTAVGVGLQLARAGDPFVVRGRWQNTFGEQYNWDHLNAKALKGGLSPWYILPRGASWPGTPPSAPVFPLRNDAVLAFTPPTLELTAVGSTAEIHFTLHGNAADFALAGWAGLEPAGTWSEQPWAALGFHPLAVAGSLVEVLVNGQPFLSPTHGVTKQRLRLYFNGTLIGPEQPWSGPETVRFAIPATVWNTAAEKSDAQVSLAFEFPDAAIPAKLEPGRPNGDPRDLAIFFQQVRLHVLP